MNIIFLRRTAFAKSGLSSKAVQPADAKELTNVSYQKYTLENGLDVLLHIDRSDPVVAINIAAHVGSSRETIGRTGFAGLKPTSLATLLTRLIKVYSKMRNKW